MAAWDEGCTGKGEKMKRILLACLSLLPMGCRSADANGMMTLTFSVYESTPVVLTDFSMEQPLAPIMEQIVSHSVDVGQARGVGGAGISAPLDVDGDGLWRLSARWVELPTDRAWQATVDIPFKELTVSYDAYRVNVIFGPNGQLLIGSDKIGNKPSDQVDIVQVCGKRVPQADRAWRKEPGRFPELPIIMKDNPPVSPDTACPAPKG